MLHTGGQFGWWLCRPYHDDGNNDDDIGDGDDMLTSKWWWLDYSPFDQDDNGDDDHQHSANDGVRTEYQRNEYL